MKMCENYLFSSHKTDIIKILANPNKEQYFSVNINFLELFEADTTLANALLSDPNESLTNWNKAICKVQTDLLKELDDNYTLKNNINCRIWSLPPWPHVSRVTFPGNDDAGQFLQITGTVVRMSARKLLEYQRQYICVKCKYPVTVEAEYDRNNIIKQPKACSNPEGCNGKNIIALGELDPCNCKDYQEIGMQEDLSKLGVGTVPNHMIVTLDNDLVNTCKPGENVTITGVVTRRWSEFDKGAMIIINIVLQANHVQVNNSSGSSIVVSEQMQQFFDNFWEMHKDNPLVGRNIILQSISPEIYGLHSAKIAIAIVLAGGSQSDEQYTSTGIDTRSKSHLLFVGDPGTGKSHLLRFASKIISRSVLTTGVGSTAAGLTVAAFMENGEWQLEAGALVMADGGICCIDEFNSMREHDRTSIHEAMEQQTISVAKAGMVCKLKTRCSILAACNAKGNLDSTKPLCVNVAMSSPLLSRFDLILLLKDVVNEEKDRELAHHLLNKSSRLSGDGTIWGLDKLQAYYCVMNKKNPKLTSDAESILSAYYQLQRKFGSRNKARTTVRLLESLIRLSQGHAKLMYHAEVEVMDAIFTIALIDGAMDVESSILNLKIVNTCFLDNPDQQYWEFLETILGKLNLEHIYQRQIEKVGVVRTIQRTEDDSNSSQISISKNPPSFFTQRRLRNREVNFRMLTQTGNTILSQNDSEIVINKPTNKLSNVDNNESKDSGNFNDLISINERQMSLNEPKKKNQNLPTVESFSCQNSIQRTENDPNSSQISISKNPPSFFTQRRPRNREVDIKMLTQTENTIFISKNDSEIVINKPTNNNESKDSGNFSDFTSVNESQMSLNKHAKKSHNLPAVETSSCQNSRNLLEVSKASNKVDEDDDLDFDSWFNNLHKATQKPNTKSIRDLQATVTNEVGETLTSTQNIMRKVPENALIDADKPSTSKSIKCLKKTDTSTSKKSIVPIEISKSSTEVDSDLDFDLWFNNLQSTVNKNTKSTCKEPNSSKINDNEETIDIDKTVKSSDISNKENSNRNKKRRSNSPIKSEPKQSSKKETDLFKLMPSVNDDFAKFSLGIDWNMGEEENLISCGIKENRNISKKPKIDVVLNDKHMPNKQPTNFRSHIQQFKFQPRSEQEKNDKSNSNQATNSTSKADSKFKFPLKKTVMDVDFSKLEEEIDNFEQNYCNRASHFNWKSSKSSKNSENIRSESLANVKQNQSLDSENQNY